jgi:hypothetical protein
VNYFQFGEFGKAAREFQEIARGEKVAERFAMTRVEFR